MAGGQNHGPPGRLYGSFGQVIAGGFACPGVQLSAPGWIDAELLRSLEQL
jgi:hypothetical protein